jgi:hypothetical protein
VCELRARFYASEVREEYEEYVGDGGYDGELCAVCAIPGFESHLHLDRAIMMNGREADLEPRW